VLNCVQQVGIELCANKSILNFVQQVGIEFCEYNIVARKVDNVKFSEPTFWIVCTACCIQIL